MTAALASGGDFCQVPARMPVRSRARYFEIGVDFCVFSFLPSLSLFPHTLAVLIVMAGVAALGLAAPAGAAAWRPLRVPAVLLGALMLWGLLSALWAVDPWRSVTMAARLSVVLAAGLALLAAAPLLAAPERLFRCLAAGAALALVFAVVQLATLGVLVHPLMHHEFQDAKLNQVQDAFAIIVLPLTALPLLRRQWAAVLLGLATAIVIYLLVGDAARVALPLGLAGAGLLYGARRRLAGAAAVLAALGVLTAPLVFPALIRIHALARWAYGFKLSMWHRLEIWDFVGARIVERPILGWGLDSSRAIPGGKLLTPEHVGLLPLHPHNVLLQTWLELGVPGAVLFAILVARVWLALGAAAWPRLYGAAAGGGLVTAFIVALGTYGLWQEWWIGTEFFLLFATAVMGRLAAGAAAAKPSPP